MDRGRTRIESRMARAHLHNCQHTIQKLRDNVTHFVGAPLSAAVDNSCHNTIPDEDVPTFGSPRLGRDHI